MCRFFDVLLIWFFLFFNDLLSNSQALVRILVVEHCVRYGSITNQILSLTIPHWRFRVSWIWTYIGVKLVFILVLFSTWRVISTLQIMSICWLLSYFWELLLLAWIDYIFDIFLRFWERKALFKINLKLLRRWSFSCSYPLSIILIIWKVIECLVRNMTWSLKSIYCVVLRRFEVFKVWTWSNIIEIRIIFLLFSYSWAIFFAL